MSKITDTWRSLRTRITSSNASRPTKESSSPKAYELTSVSTHADFKKKLRESLLNLPCKKNDQQWQQNARAVFIRHSIAWELGTEALNHPNINDIVNSVESDIANNEPLKTKYDAYIESIVNSND